MTFTNFVHEGVQSIHVDNFGSGSISVEPGPRPDAVEGSLNMSSDRGLEEVAIRCEADQLRISMPQQSARSTPAHLRLGVPADLSYAVRAGSATITFSAHIASAKIISGSGDVSVEQAGELDCTTGSGSVAVGRLVGRGARIHTGSGDVTVAEARCPVSAKSGSGDVLIRTLHRADLTASSGSGDISVPSTSGSVDLRSASGSLTVGVADDLKVWLDLHSASGPIRIALEASPEPGPGEPYLRVRARTASGDIAVYRA